MGLRLRRATAMVLGIALWLALPIRTIAQTEAALPTAGILSVAAPSAVATLPTTRPTPSNLAATLPSAVPSTTASGKKKSAAGLPIDAEGIIANLTQVIDWHREIDLEVRASSEAEETLFATDDRRMADEILSLAFDFARAAEKLPSVGTTTSSSTSANPQSVKAPTGSTNGEAGVSPLDDLIKRRDELQKRLDQLTDENTNLRRGLKSANRSARDSINRQVAANQEQTDLVKSRIGSIDNLVNFEKGMDVTRGSTLPLDAQIDALEHSVSNSEKVANPTPPSSSNAVLPAVERLMALRDKGRALTTAIALTSDMSESVNGLRETLIRMVEATDREGVSQARQVGTQDLQTGEKTKAQFSELVSRGQLIANALLPLEKQLILLQLYSNNLERWRDSVHQRFGEALRSQLISVASVALVLGLVFAAAAVWRHLTLRYVGDLQRRQKVLQLRRIVLIIAVVLVLLFGFSSQLKSLATVMGFAAAGIALALQNVIISFVAYFYLSGRFGIRAGDRVQITGITGDVLEIGFFKITLMELSGEDRGKLPTGRAVIFPNSVLFQPNSNFFRQLPGTSFTWNELRLTLAPDCDYRQTEELVTEVVNDVFARYRDTVQREYRTMAGALNLPIETPRPQSRLQIGTDGLEMVVRYPTRLAAATQTADEITRRLVDAIKREPGLKLAVPGVPSIQAEIEAAASGDQLAAAPPPPDSAGSSGIAQTNGPGEARSARPEKTADQPARSIKA
jgi:small-conductance mechanosensitive channel